MSNTIRKTECAVSELSFAHTEESHPSTESYYRHNHTQYELYIFFNGATEFLVEDRLYKMRHGNILLIRPLEYHYATICNTDVPYERVVLNFDRHVVYPELYDFLDSRRELFVWDDAIYTPLLDDLERNLEIYEKQDAVKLVYTFLNRLLLHLKYTPLTDTLPLRDPTIGEILSYINRHIYEPLSLQDIARHTYRSANHISHLFSQYMKTGLMTYVKQKKMLLAQSLLHQGVSPTETARTLGFSDYTTFYRLYKKTTGNMPKSRK